MNKKATDHAITYWFLRCLLGPVSLLSLGTFTLGYWQPDAIDAVRPIAQKIGLHYLVAIRTMNADFDSAAYFYWLTFWVTLPLSLIWMHREGVKKNMTNVLRAVAKANLESGAWNPEKFTLNGGLLRFSFFALLTTSLLVVQLLSAREPSYCKGCETTSVFGFLLINWLGVHLMLIASYIACSYLVLWKSIRTFFGVKK
jgi:hypothetical protein